MNASTAQYSVCAETFRVFRVRLETLMDAGATGLGHMNEQKTVFIGHKHWGTPQTDSEVLVGDQQSHAQAYRGLEVLGQHPG